MSNLEKDSALDNRELKMREYSFRARITGNATPASKTHRGELPNVAILRSQGKTADADAVENLSASFATAADATGIFGILLKGSELGEIDQCIAVAATPIDGGTATVAFVNTGTVAYGLSAGGNIAIDVDTSKNLTSADCDIIVSLKYYLK